MTAGTDAGGSAPRRLDSTFDAAAGVLSWICARHARPPVTAPIRRLLRRTRIVIGDGGCFHLACCEVATPTVRFGADEITDDT